MALLNKLKSLLGLGNEQSDSDRQRTDVGVTVEHEPETADGDEEAPPATPTPGTETATPEPVEDDPVESPDGPDIDPEVESPPVEGSEKSPEEIESRGETAESTTEPTSGPAVDAGPSDSDDGTEVKPETETSLESGTVETESADAEPATDDVSLRDIKGIGPSYATKLSEAGIDSASALANADAEELSSSTGLSEKRIQGWIDRARTE
jgi:predicted flap endonuclease-1-like 5' DNA nuclease